ncbi:caffeoylshikimate esterase-like [Rutidosis leptorrhynchoides]|uniref:caffeoylshikimate esterase-like n=1 Tax=Rutidosis leptorrhynchoides TaxID=125765 RepID=UPI003A9A4281
MATESSNVKYEEEFIKNSKGIKLFTCRWMPVDIEPKALVFLNHGYAMECSVSMKGAAMRLVKAGFGVYGIDNQGHGKSDGIQGFISCFDDLVDDCSQFFTSICERKENKYKLRILLGESMGGAMVLRLHRKKPEFWDGGVLVAPMCKLAEDMKPPQIVFSVLLQLTKVIPTWRIVPGQDIIELAFRDPKIREEIRNNPLCYKGRLRLKTALELFNVTVDLEKKLKEVKMPFLVVHGEDDKVTDPLTSKLLYETASSKDKTLKLYPKMWHALTYGEFTENTDTVFADIVQWINEKIAQGNSRLEREQKNKNDELKKN